MTGRSEKTKKKRQYDCDMQTGILYNNINKTHQMLLNMNSLNIHICHHNFTNIFLYRDTLSFMYL
jgi:hypothetical protein